MKHPLAKLEKQRRYWRWRLASGKRVPLWWHVGRPNFGDDLNPDLFEKLAGVPVRFPANRLHPHLLGMGSILGKSLPASIICGSGLLCPPGPDTRIEGSAVAVRGELSRQALAHHEDDLLLGDPAVLISEIFEAPKVKHHAFGFVPHVDSIDRWKTMDRHGHHVIDPSGPVWSVVRQIAACETVFCQSLHGMITADALQIPNVWVAPSETMRGGRFKFDDYMTTVDAAKEMVPETADLFSAPAQFAATVSRYRYDKTAYRDRLRAVFDDFDELAI
ncbi:polysaccharide pyruvyl transferase family protein [Pseudohoeflea coraliihabitans]|uniref:Polysaccharide pyruvyl transferase family protein n=1 Tax=Pseudohoeflea coraliihabitans TaxID=2860393 RepID=A0ABS6WIM4_9HYPH|nr:polysaccharide pyruvyl transferase family protein [Pseudohoeflea sp. DP4N28-3]MBW3095710.1 polysaccharide pyruvyl transferase family protein [Pseudohoeflea sp. DP4N28-3]